MTIVQIKKKQKVKEKNERKAVSKLRNPIRRLAAVLTVAAVLLSLSITALAADISAERAKQIALSDAGYSVGEVSFIRAVEEYDDGVRHWNVEFHVDSEGGYRDYDYEISSSSGRILERDVDFERVTASDALETGFENLIRRLISWLLSIFK